MPNHEDIEIAKSLCLDALSRDGAHHKQWYLERIEELLGVDLDAAKKNDDDWEPGIAP